MMDTQLVFVTLPAGTLESLTLDEGVVLDYGTTDRQGDDCLILRNGPEARRILDDLLEAGLLLDYTEFTLPLAF
jgi:hypothetical protein